MSEAIVPFSLGAVDTEDLIDELMGRFVCLVLVAERLTEKRPDIDHTIVRMRGSKTHAVGLLESAKEAYLDDLRESYVSGRDEDDEP